MNPYEKMEETRKLKGITMTHIAKHCGHSVSWYNDIAKGRNRVSVDDIILIADAMNEDVRNFFDQKLSVTLRKGKKSNSA